jgi:23S rRNA (cytidine1920-2'-O)/16S rRNA (cytidine1409-2'-O)-methyltransferase
MLQAGAVTVVAVDTGYGQIAQRLRDDPRVTLRERTNARKLETAELLLPGQPAPTFFAMDVSFISATLVLPSVLKALRFEGGEDWQGTGVILIKPQFEAGRHNVGKGGIVRDPEARRLAIERVTDAVAELGGARLDVIDSPIHGMEGNHEYLLRAVFGAA